MRAAAPEVAIGTLHRLIDQIGLPDGLAWGVAKAGEGALLDIETAAVARAVPQRRAEFTAGREAARRAMAQLGLPALAIPAGPDRAPIWPDGLIGSISHTVGLCLAIVGPAEVYRALGIDIEGDAALDDALIPEICRPEERALLPRTGAGAHAKRIFSAKEAAYKAHYPMVRRIFGFHGLSVDLRQGYARFTDHAEVASLAPDSRMDLPLLQAVGGGLILSVSVLRADLPGGRSHLRHNCG